MKINTTQQNRSFGGLYNNKFFLNTLEGISDHGASFCAGVSLASAMVLRPVAISLTPGVEKENKKDSKRLTIHKKLTFCCFYGIIILVKLFV